jgi:hypothetical protein
MYMKNFNREMLSKWDLLVGVLLIPLKDTDIYRTYSDILNTVVIKGRHIT